jgi:hypothetical protein
MNNFSLNKSLKYISTVLFIAAAVISIKAAVYAAPALTAEPAPTHRDTSIYLSWSTVSGATYYDITRSTDGGVTETDVATLTVGTSLYTTQYTDTGLIPKSTYTYKVYAHSGAGLLATMQDDATTAEMLAPSNLKAVYDVNTRDATLTWTDESTATTSNTVYYYYGGIPASVTYAAGTATIHDVEEPEAFVVSAKYNDSISSGNSEPVSVTPIGVPPIYAVVYDGTTYISWGDPDYIFNSDDITNFSLQRASYSNGTWSSWTTLTLAVNGYYSYTTDIPPTGGFYKYRFVGKGSGAYPYTGYSDESDAICYPVLNASITSPTTVQLTWNLPQNDIVSKARIYCGTSQTDMDMLAAVDASSGTYTHTISSPTLESGATYYYYIVVETPAYEDPESATVSVSSTLPAAPTGLSARLESASSIVLNWTDNSSNETGFHLQRKEGNGSFYDIPVNTENPALSPNTTTYTDNYNIAAGVTYTYRICSFNLIGSSSYSSTVSVAATTSVAPTSLTATVASSSQVDLLWSYKDAGSYSTVIERKTGENGEWAVLATTSYGVVKYSDTGLASNTQYYYRVRKFVSADVSAITYPNNNTGISALTLLPTPSLTVSAYASDRMLLTWSGTPAAADTVIERKLANGTFAVMGTVSYGTSTWYDTTGLIAKAIYSYRIKFVTSTNASVYSSVVSAAYNYLNAPTGLAASAYDTTLGKTSGSGAQKLDAIRLAWTDNSTNESGFEIWRRPYGISSFTLYDTVGENISEYIDDNVQAGIQYYYMVRGYISSIGLYSNYTNTESSGIDIIPPPSSLQYSIKSTSTNTNGTSSTSITSIVLTWIDNSTNETYFKVQRRTVSASDEDDEASAVWTDIGNVSSNNVTYTDTGLSDLYVYKYRVMAYSSSGNFSSYSNEITVSTSGPKAPTGLTANAISSSQINLSWKDNSDNETKFIIMRKSMNSLP